MQEEAQRLHRWEELRSTHAPYRVRVLSRYTYVLNMCGCEIDFFFNCSGGTQLVHMMWRPRPEVRSEPWGSLLSRHTQPTTASILPLGFWSRSRSSSLPSPTLTFIRYCINQFVNIRRRSLTFLMTDLNLFNRSFLFIIVDHVACWCCWRWGYRWARYPLPPWKRCKLLLFAII